MPVNRPLHFNGVHLNAWKFFIGHQKLDDRRGVNHVVGTNAVMYFCVAVIVCGHFSYAIPLLFGSKLSFSGILDFHFRPRSDGVHAFGYNSAESERISMKSWALWLHCLICLRLALADFGRDLQSIATAREPCEILFLILIIIIIQYLYSALKSCKGYRGAFCQVNNAPLYRIPVGQISRNLNSTRRSVSRWFFS